VSAGAAPPVADPGGPICLYVRRDSHRTHVLLRNLTITMVVLMLRTRAPGGAVQSPAAKKTTFFIHGSLVLRRWTVHMAAHRHSCKTRNYVADSRESARQEDWRVWSDPSSQLWSSWL